MFGPNIGSLLHPVLLRPDSRRGTRRDSFPFCHSWDHERCDSPCDGLMRPVLPWPLSWPHWNAIFVFFYRYL